ncbi:PDGLE domain-containing protein [Saccharopolyspora phatthalungensis]|uniref:Cobalt/nickel transport protein n=1 Tax=Saccharopolyspora phatthalungensis TaxID=664693 RepID=A0A840QDL7_9PSEU|nr:PDGLE domain-containing protein [Saccharopolyspora phatthalungensis]MBB5157900.1 cobalt/nickel transport protein [Saccharopolyspora phatthalungensis]
MSVPRRRFLLVFGLFVLVIAGGVAYFADSAPDGLDSVTQRGCTVVQTAQGERLEGHCIAQNVTKHVFSGGPLADYTVGGDDRWTGLAGVIGAAVTLGAAGGLFWGLRRRTGGE